MHSNDSGPPLTMTAAGIADHAAAAQLNMDISQASPLHSASLDALVLDNATSAGGQKDHEKISAQTSTELDHPAEGRVSGHALLVEAIRRRALHLLRSVSPSDASPMSSTHHHSTTDNDDDVEAEAAGFTVRYGSVMPFSVLKNSLPSITSGRVHCRVDRVSLTVPVEISVNHRHSFQHHLTHSCEIANNSTQSPVRRSLIDKLSSRDRIERKFAWPTECPNEHWVGECSIVEAKEVEQRVQQAFGMDISTFLERAQTNTSRPRGWGDGANYALSMSEQDVTKALEVMYKGGKNIVRCVLMREDTAAQTG